MGNIQPHLVNGGVQKGAPRTPGTLYCPMAVVCWPASGEASQVLSQQARIRRASPNSSSQLTSLRGGIPIAVVSEPGSVEPVPRAVVSKPDLETEVTPNKLTPYHTYCHAISS